MIYRRVLPWVLCAAFLFALPLSTAVGQTGDTARLALDDCLRIALQNNLDLIAARKDPLIAEQRIEVNKAQFDGAIEAGGNYNQVDTDRDITDNISLSQGTATGEDETLTGNVSFSHKLSYGADYSLSYSATDRDTFDQDVSPATGDFTQIDSLLTSQGLSLRYDMPLLNGFGKEVNTVDILLARGGLEISKEDLRVQAMATIQSAENAYWDLLAARAAVKVSKDSLHRAEELLELNKKKVEVGTLAPIEITEAEAGVAAQVEAVIVAETTLENAEDVLLQLMAVPVTSPLWEQTLELTDQPSFDPIAVVLEDAIATALEHRPEIASGQQSLRDSELSERVARRRVRHGLDLTAIVTPGEGDLDQLVERQTPLGLTRSDSTTVSDSTNWTLGLVYRYPFRNRNAKANYGIAKINAEKSNIALQSIEQDIRVEVRRSVRETESGIQRVAAASKNVELQKKKLEAEQKKFDNGMSTSFEVLTFQNDLADAELKKIRAALDYLKSLTALERSKGTLLEARGLSLGY